MTTQTQTQYHNQATSQMGYMPPAQATTQPQNQPQEPNQSKNQIRHIFSLGRRSTHDTSQHRNTPNSYDHEEITVRCEQPSLDWQRRWQIHRLHKYNRQNTTKKDYPQWYLNNPNDYDTPKRPLPETTTPETYIHDPDFNCDPYHNPKIYDKTTLTFKQRECTPFEEFIKTTGMNISTEPRHRPKTIQPVPEYDQDTERVTEILVDESTTRPKSILKNHGSQTTAPQSPPKHQTTNPIRAGIVRSPTMDVAPDCHQTQKLTDRTTTEAVDLTQTTTNTEITISTPQTRRIKRSLLLEPLSYNEASPSPSSPRSQPANEVEDPRPTTAAETNKQSESPSGAVFDTPTQHEPQSYPMAQIAEYFTRDHITKEECIPIFSAVTLKKKKKMLFAPMDLQDLTLDALIDSGALVNCISETDYNKILQMSPKDIVKELEPPPFKLQVANGDIDTPTKTIILQFEIGDWNFKETFIVAKRLTGPILGLTFLKNNSAILDVSQGLLHFPHLTYSIETDEFTRNRKLYKVQVKSPLTIPPETTQTITAYADITSTIDTTGVINPATNHCSGDPLVVASSISTASNRKIDVRVTNTTPTPYTIKKNTTVAEFQIMSPEDAKELKPLNTAALKVLTYDDSEDAIIYIN